MLQYRIIHTVYFIWTIRSPLKSVSQSLWAHSINASSISDAAYRTVKYFNLTLADIVRVDAGFTSRKEINKICEDYVKTTCNE
jgi:hypothetical protein